jgi:hypothetical protein
VFTRVEQISKIIFSMIGLLGPAPPIIFGITSDLAVGWLRLWNRRRCRYARFHLFIASFFITAVIYLLIPIVIIFFVLVPFFIIFVFPILDIFLLLFLLIPGNLGTAIIARLPLCDPYSYNP